MKVSSVNLARASLVSIDGRKVPTGIGKRAVEGAVPVASLGLQGDEQAEPPAHGGIAKAVYAYPQEHYAFWQTVRAQAGVADWNAALPMGAMGENLTITGLLEDRLFVGDQLVLPDCVLAVSEPRLPCSKFNAAMGFKHAAKMMLQSGFCGSYLAVLVAGTVRAGDPIEFRPGRQEVNIRDLFRSRVRG